MKRWVPLFIAVCAAAATAISNAAALPMQRALTAEAMHGSIVGTVPASTPIKIHVLLASQRENELDRFIQMQNTPGTQAYRQYLTPQEFGRYFGAAPAAYGRAVAALRAQGFTIDELANNRRDIVAHAPAAVISRFFQTPLDVRQERGRMFYAARYEPLLPPGLNIELVSGLSDYRLLHSHMRSHQTIGGEFSYAPGDLAVAYDLNPLYQAGLNGQGVTMANATAGAARASDLAQFQKIFKLPAATLESTPIDGALSTSAGKGCGGNGESTLDADSATATARNVTFHQVVAHTCGNKDFDDMYKYIVDTLGSSTHVVTTSWGACEQDQYIPELKLDESYFQQAAAEGQWWFSASGDNGTDDCEDGTTTSRSVDFPGSSPYVISVGGTDIHATVSGGIVTAYGSETVWQYGACNFGNGTNSNGAGGGGKSITYTKPAYQNRRTPNDGRRDVPDVSLMADDVNNGLFIYDGGLQPGNGGTSDAAPQWAALLAIVEQKKGNYKNVVDPHYRLYTLAASPRRSQYFHDVVGGNNGVPACADDYHVYAGYDAITGYDLASGIGSYIGAALVNAY